MSTLSGQQGAGSKENPPGQSSLGSISNIVLNRYLGSSSVDRGYQGSQSQTSNPEKSSSETVRTSDALSGLGSSDEGEGTRGTTAGEFAGEGPSVHTEAQRSLAEGASHS
ncbi:uncharacterized protein Z519_11793 [Cladophialophora bantiana CBS 173.52]|uniref:Uncharacterized protein n=1 Tax=Cladophialophora bantiana (strain ATCC 10958 / CBS 173.52 / CDC B-1940 / NIH 8579) TaxID=1442370 RepID=A0A0D2H9B9_CLAB1|nr:uncharacterized protein Z519_11793 [Cladophialophora bantiana CBS 173.52]KIW87470.1 hypothetical protein Z519_11793 [Cladophialophora bantiana CBS 173.52]